MSENFLSPPRFISTHAQGYNEMFVKEASRVQFTYLTREGRATNPALVCVVRKREKSNEKDMENQQVSSLYYYTQ